MFFHRRLPQGALSLFVFAFAVLPARAQTALTLATVTGTVQDTSRATVPGVSVTILALETNQRAASRTDTEGRFRFLALPVGRYRLTAEFAGFVPARTEITLAVGQTFDVPLTLKPAGLSEQVVVTSDAPVVEIARTQSSERVSPQEVERLPLNGRNYLDLALLTPGVSRTNTGAVQRFAETSAVPGTGISVSSQRNLNNTFLVDGLSANDDAAELAGTFYSQEVIREFQVVSGGGMAEFGRASSGIVNVVTQSGTNIWRGGGYGFFRDARLDALNALTHRRDPLSQQQAGASIAGPLRRDRAFLFSNVERTRNHQTGLVTIATAAVETINATLAQRAYRGSAIQTGTFATGYDATNVFGRLDAPLTSANRLTARYSSYLADSPNSRTAGGLNALSRGTGLHNYDQTGAATLLTTLPGATVNELRGQVTRSRLAAPVNDPIGPAVTISGVASFGTSTGAPTGRALDVIEVAETLTTQHASHVLKVGASALLDRVTIEFPGAAPGTYAFSNLANFQAGRYSTFQQAFGAPSQFQSNLNLTAFAQDEWRPRSGLTLNAGLRYDLQQLPAPVQTDTNNVSPRIGVAFAPGNRRTVIRASGGLYFNPIPLRATSNALQRDGSKYQVAVYSFGQAGAPAFPAVLPAFPAGLLISITTIDPEIASAVSRQAAVQLEREIAAGVSVTVGYQHLGGHQIIMQRNANAPTLSVADANAIGVPNLGRPNPLYANIARYESIGESAYNGATVSLQARGRSWWNGRLSYTYSRAFDDAGNAFFSQPQDANDVRADWGPSDNDQRHRLTVSGGIAAPHLSGSTLRRLLADWRLSGIVSYTSALPFNVQLGADRNNDTNTNDRPAGVRRNSARGFDYASLDLRVTRALGSPRRHVDLMIEGFNAFNRANYLVPNNTFGSGTTPVATFGQATAVNDPRQLQVGFRVAF